MSRDLIPAEINQLELLVDTAGVQAILEGLSTVCGYKADHIEHNFQDRPSAKMWRTAEGAIGCFLTKREIAAISL